MNACICFSQEHKQENSDVEQQLEDLAEDEITSDNDFYLTQLANFRTNALNLNEVDGDELKELKFLTDLQVQNFLQYRNLLGPLLSMYELQAIPAWDIYTIKKILPFVKISDSKKIKEHISERLKSGDNTFLFRLSAPLQKAKGFINDSAGKVYPGSPTAILVRYKYNYKNLLQYGFLGDKDPGEQFFKGTQKHGFDFYSYHFFIRKVGMIKCLAIGDFIVNMGQGLMHWQNFAFKKTASVILVKRQSEVIRPFTSSREYNLERGVGISLEKNKWQSSVFASVRKLSATIKIDSNFTQPQYISSLLNSGYHRTSSELTTRKNVKAFSAGGNIQFNTANWHTGLNYVQYAFSKPFHPSNKPYDLFAIDGKRWGNWSFDYNYTFRNYHLYGEVAVDQKMNVAIINGMIASIDRAVDLAVVHRKIDKQYQSIYGNSFTENLLPTNEAGIYLGLSIRPFHACKIDVYADFYKFPWLKYSIDSPGYGREFFMRIVYNPTKQLELNIRYKNEVKHSNFNSPSPLTEILLIPRSSLRTHFSYRFSRSVLFKKRVELLWYGNKTINREGGYLAYTDLHYKPFSLPLAGNLRLQYFETDGFDSRLYAFENDVLYNYSTPVFFGKGFRWYFNIRTDVSQLLFPGTSKVEIDLSVKYAITHYFQLDKIGSGNDEIQGKRKSELAFQLLISR